MLLVKLTVQSSSKLMEYFAIYSGLTTRKRQSPHWWSV